MPLSKARRHDIDLLTLYADDTRRLLMARRCPADASKDATLCHAHMPYYFAMLRSFAVILLRALRSA